MALDVPIKVRLVRAKTGFVIFIILLEVLPGKAIDYPQNWLILLVDDWHTDGWQGFLFLALFLCIVIFSGSLGWSSFSGCLCR